MGNIVMVKIIITEEHEKEAENLYNFGVLNNSITKGEGNKSGSLGEVVARRYLNAIQKNTYDYDLIFNNKTIDVKTKNYKVGLTPSTNWNLNVSDSNTTQKCDYYLFIGISTNFKEAYFYGYIEKDEFYRVAKFHKKGDIDPTSYKNFPFREDCHNILINKLKTNISQI